MKKTEIEEKLKILQKLYKTDFLRPFPIKDCRVILSESDAKFSDFVPSLDVYFSDVAGYCSWGKRIENWSFEKIIEAKHILRKSFFQRFSKFSVLESKISENKTPNLHSQLLITDLMRLTLVDVLSEIETRNSKRKPEYSFVS